MPPAPLLACPDCHAPLEPASPNELVCPQDGLRFPQVDGVWRLLLPGRADLYEKFVREYETIRLAEGRRSPDPAYYRALPHRDLSGRLSADWRIRAVSFNTLMQKIVRPSRASLRVLDLGAGNGWLSNRLALEGHQVLAVDLTTNDFDGLGCYRFYASSFTPVQAEFDHLPCAAGGADLLIFNASLHYSTNLRETLSEALRVLASGGSLVLMDSPVYHDPESGKSMVWEREAQFAELYGFPSNALKSENFLTYSRLESLGRDLKINWHFFSPFYGLQWALKPVRAYLLGRREPAHFHVILGTPIQSDVHL